MKKLLSFLLSFFPLLLIAQKKVSVDLLVYNAKIYTVNEKFSVVEAMALQGGKIAALGTAKELEKKYAPSVRINAEGKAVYPGLIDAHAHFVNYGLGLQQADLVGTTSWKDILQRLTGFAQRKNLTAGAWVIGRGWDQNDWAEKEYPTKAALDSLFPQNPVLLVRVDGHAAIANSAALKTAGVQAGQTLVGGSIEVKNGELTGILIDNAVDLVTQKIPAPSAQQLTDAVLDAQANLFAVGLTTVDDCGVSTATVEFLNRLQQDGKLFMRVYAMLSDDPANFNYLIKRGKIKTPYLNVQSFKVYADGALGSRGAALLKPYSDRPDWSGFLLSPLQHFDSVAAVIKKHNFQMCTHAIGDSGNRAVLQIYAKHLGGANNRRWRIEHAQVVAPEDFHLFKKYSVVPSVQPTHATSDMYWAGDRLGAQRLKGAYAYKQLMQQLGWLPLGTDFPVEDISPFKTFYAAVARRDSAGYPAGGFQTENALSRQEALRGMTIWAAKSNFEEGEKGSLEVGKWADFIILDRDIMTVPLPQVLNTKVMATYVGGRKVHSQR